MQSTIDEIKIKKEDVQEKCSQEETIPVDVSAIYQHDLHEQMLKKKKTTTVLRLRGGADKCCFDDCPEEDADMLFALQCSVCSR